MRLNFCKPSMPVIEQLTKEIDLTGQSIIVVQHGVKDTIDLCLKLKNNSNADVLFLPKPFSQQEKDLNYGLDNGLRIENPGKSYEEGLEKQGYLEDILRESNHQNSAIIEVGGVFAKVFKENSELAEGKKGLVEVTTFGHNRHEEAGTFDKIPFFSIARSEIKEREAKHVGLAVYRSLDRVIHDLDRDITACNVGVIGYGMIGKNVCNAFRNCESIEVYDADESRLSDLPQEFKKYSSKEKFMDNDIIIASTGQQSITKEFIDMCGDQVLLVSAGSRQNEIDVEYLEKNKTDKENIHTFIDRYHINGKDVFLFREGKNANFAGNSCPSTSMDLIHAETLICLKNILNGNYELGKINTTTKEERDNIISISENYYK